MLLPFIDTPSGPLAHRARPTALNEFIGSEKIFKKYSFLGRTYLPNLIIHGPPGSGKTTLAFLIAQESEKSFYKFNAVLGGVADLKKLIGSIEPNSVIFIDEIHRFNKAQQDALLPYIEEGQFTLIGATTESPRVSVNRALLSRSQIIELNELNNAEILELLIRVKNKFAYAIPDSSLEIIARFTSGDARIAINTMELALNLENQNEEEIKKLISENIRAYDKNGNRHYDVISCFIKSMRGNDPDRALLALAIMLDGNEDPMFIARRMVIFASEDIGNADPSALTMATSAMTAVSQIGMPESRIILAQVASYLAITFKSRKSYEAIDLALTYVQNKSTIDPFTETIKESFYKPSLEGKEDGIQQRLKTLKKTPPQKN